MKLLAFEAREFRNLKSVVVAPHPRFNVFWGDNGQGKTNLLEAIYLIATLRSFRASKTEELVRVGATEALVRARVERQTVKRLFEVALAPSRKHGRVDGKGVRAADYFGGFNVVLFAPEDLALPKGPPSGRRRFVDRAVWNAYPDYLAEVQTYERVLKSRNALLRENASDALLEVYDAQLGKAAVPIVRRRADLIGELSGYATAAFERVTRTGLSLAISYQRALAGADIEQSLMEKLNSDRPRDRARGATSSGPHTDDLELILDGRAAKVHASQGQLRAIVLALKIAEIEFIHDKLGDPPVLLLDDVSSELDPTRNAQLFEFLRSVKSQAFITTTRKEHLHLTQERLDFQVVAGELRS